MRATVAFRIGVSSHLFNVVMFFSSHLHSKQACLQSPGWIREFCTSTRSDSVEHCAGLCVTCT